MVVHVRYNPWALVKPVKVNIRDGQNLTAITEASRIIARPSRISAKTWVFKKNITPAPSVTDYR